MALDLLIKNDPSWLKNCESVNKNMRWDHILLSVFVTAVKSQLPKEEGKDKYGCNLTTAKKKNNSNPKAKRQKSDVAYRDLNRLQAKL